MGGRRVAKRVVGWVISAVVVAPVAAVVLGVLVDRGPGGSGRLTAFPMALAASDGSVRESARNSLMLASGVSLAALVLGVGLARFVAGRAFRGRSALIALAEAPGAVPPLFGAIGLVGLLGAERFGPGPLRWLTLAGLELTWAVPRVMASAIAVLERVPPSWGDAARMAGASKRRAWWVASWPVTRPVVGRTVAGIFAFVLVEPTAPLVLGVRRTLGFAIVDAATRGDRFGRAAALGATALVLVVIGRLLILSRVGPVRGLPSESQGTNRPRTSWLGLIAAGVALAAWSFAGLLPIAALGATALGLTLESSGRFAVGPHAFAGAIRDDRAWMILADGAILGIGATVIAALVVLAGGLGWSRASWRAPASWPRVVPGLLFGLGVALLPRLCDGAAGAMARHSPLAAIALHRTADFADPFLSPWLVLIAAVAILRLPEMARAASEARGGDDRPRIDVARTLGASPWTAWRTIRGPRTARIWGRALARSFARSAFDVGPALMLAPTLAARPIAPGLLAMLAEPGGMTRAAAVASLAMALPLTTRIVAGPAGDDR